jgi:hypothetical protein
MKIKIEIEYEIEEELETDLTKHAARLSAFRVLRGLAPLVLHTRDKPVESPWPVYFGKPQVGTAKFTLKE